MRRFSRMPYWEERAAQFGRRAVLNLGHPDEEFDAVTERQKRELFPALTRLLRGDERLILDFGCGPGRFTVDLAALIAGRAIGVDPIRRFIDLAPAHANVEYRAMTEGTLPLPDESVDVVWVCLVLGGIGEARLLSRTVAELERVLRRDGLLFLAENTSRKPDGRYWIFRSVDQYTRMFPFAGLAHLHDYCDLGERISVLGGRKPS